MQFMKRTHTADCTGEIRSIGRFWRLRSVSHARSGRQDADFFGTGIAVGTTCNIEIFLEAQVTAYEDEGV
jgi:hypothetical protein